VAKDLLSESANTEPEAVATGFNFHQWLSLVQRFTLCELESYPFVIDSSLRPGLNPVATASGSVFATHLADPLPPGSHEELKVFRFYFANVVRRGTGRDPHVRR
jgi:hypothetical protein